MGIELLAGFGRETCGGGLTGWGGAGARDARVRVIGECVGVATRRAVRGSGDGGHCRG